MGRVCLRGRTFGRRQRVSKSAPRTLSMVMLKVCTYFVDIHTCVYTYIHVYTRTWFSTYLVCSARVAPSSPRPPGREPRAGAGRGMFSRGSRSATLDGTCRCKSGKRLPSQPPSTPLLSSAKPTGARDEHPRGVGRESPHRGVFAPSVAGGSCKFHDIKKLGVNVCLMKCVTRAKR